jgi:hypothetical protein
MNIYYDSQMNDDDRRTELYRGSLFTYSPTPSGLKLCDLARELIKEAFHPFDPLTVHECIPVERCVEILAILKPKFIHHPKSKQYIQGMLTELGCDLENTYFDVPRLRTAFPSDYLSSGIAYAFHPHRDTWYSAPFSQLNWWMPVYEICPQNCLAFHPPYWAEPVPNNSNLYNYYEWNRVNRKSAADHIKTDSRIQPRPLEPIDVVGETRLLTAVGGVIAFSGAHLHSSVVNTSGLTRFSIDFRTVHLNDVWSRRGAPNMDSACTGTTLRDYLRGTDLSHIPAEAVALYDDGTENSYVPSPTSAQELSRR